MGPTVVLFDIDGTLVLTGGAGRRAMEHAFLAVTGRADACAHFSFAGMTDRAIAREGLAQVARAPVTEADIDALLEVYLDRLDVELAASAGYQVLPGVVAALDTLGARAAQPGARLALGLGTGNVRRGAYKKLARGGIDRAFAFGGFGCDAEDRAELLRAGARRGAEVLGAEVASCRVVVVGDTPKDVDAAERAGFSVVAVATGSFSAADLRALGPAHVFESLADPSALSAILG